MAKGIEVAVEVMRALAKDAINGKVDATDIRIAAASLEASAERKRAAAGTANRARRRIGKETPGMQWRKIKAETYRTFSDPDGFDEARVRIEETGETVEVWDCHTDHDADGRVVLELARGEYPVSPSFLIEVR